MNFFMIDFCGPTFQKLYVLIYHLHLGRGLILHHDDIAPPAVRLVYSCNFIDNRLHNNYILSMLLSVGSGNNLFLGLIFLAIWVFQVLC